MKKLLVAICLCVFMVAGCAHNFEDRLVPGMEVPPYPFPADCIQPLEKPVTFDQCNATWVRYESSLWACLGDDMYLPEFYEPSEAPAGYLKARMYWPGKWEATIEFIIGCNHFAEPADITVVIGEIIAMVADGHLTFGAFQNDHGFDLAWLERSLNGAITAMHLVGAKGEFRIEFVIIGYDIHWCDTYDEWQHQQWPE